MNIEIRWVSDSKGNMQLQQRTRQPVVDVAGAFCGYSDKWSDWSAVPILYDSEELRPVVHVYKAKQ